MPDLENAVPFEDAAVKPEVIVQQTQHSKWAAGIVTVGSMMIIGGVLMVLNTHLTSSNEAAVQPLNAQGLIEACLPKLCTEATLLFMMEQDAQILRSERFRAAINERMAIYVIAEIVALMLVALGSVLIFDRIKANDKDEAKFGRFTFTSAWPGAMLCFFGTFILVSALTLTVSSGYRLSLWDKPIFLSDPNWARNTLRVLSGQGDDPSAAWLEKLNEQGLKAGEDPAEAAIIPDLPPTPDEDNQ